MTGQTLPHTDDTVLQPEAVSLAMDIGRDVHLNIGYLYGIADAVAVSDADRAGAIRQCLAHITRALAAAPPAQAPCRDEGLREALEKVRDLFVVEHYDDGRIASVGHGSDSLRKMVAILDAALSDDPRPVVESGEAVAHYQKRSGLADAIFWTSQSLRDAMPDSGPLFANLPRPASAPDWRETERNDYVSDAQARDLFGIEDEDELPEGRVRVCEGEWVRIPGGYYFDASAGLLHPETASEASAPVPSGSAMREAALDALASLVAAVSLLKRVGKHGKQSAPSNLMFDQMIVDYEASITRTRAALTSEPKP